jgi:hypothetical protein
MVGSDWTSVRSEMGPEGQIELQVATDPGSLAERWALWSLNRARRTWAPWWVLPAALLGSLVVQGGFFLFMFRGVGTEMVAGPLKYFAPTLILNLAMVLLAAILQFERRGYVELLDRYAIELRRLQRAKGGS